MRSEAFEYRTEVTIAPLTTTTRSVPSLVGVTPEEDGVPQSSAINLDDLQTIPMDQLERRITTLSPERMAEVDRAIKFALALR